MSLDPNGARISISVGIAIGLLASFVQSLGLTIQRKSHVLNQQLPLHLQVVEHRRPSVAQSVSLPTFTSSYLDYSLGCGCSVSVCVPCSPSLPTISPLRSHIRFLKPPRLCIPDCFLASSHTRPPWCSIITLERFLCKNPPRR